MKKRNLEKYVVPLAIASVFILALVVGIPSLTQSSISSIYTSGWEIYNQISAIRCQAGIKSSANEFTYPRELGAVQWKVDVDEINYGEPTIMIQTSDIRHVDFTGQPTPNEVPAQTRTVIRDNHTYYLDYHIYMFDMTIRTVADAVIIYPAVWGINQNVWEHETSWALQSTNIGAPTGKVGKPFQGGPYIKFAISPWLGGTYHVAPDNYVIENAWAGVMNSYVHSKEQGQVANQWGEKPNPSVGEADITSVGALDNGAQINMYLDNGVYGTQSPTVSWDTSVTPDTRIQSTVLLYLPVQIEAGAYLTKNILGEVYSMTPCDCYVKYTVRVDVLQTHDFVLETAYKPPNLDIPEDYFSWAKGFWDSLFSSPNFYFFIIIIAILIAMKIMFGGKKNGKQGGTQGEAQKRYSGLTMFDWAVIGALGLLTFIPDPTDMLDIGLPILEPLMAFAYWYMRKKGGGKT